MRNADCGISLTPACRQAGFPSPLRGEGGVGGRYALSALRYALFIGGIYGKTHSFRQKRPSEDGRCKQEVANPAGGHCPRIGLYESKDFQKDYVRED